MTAIALDIAHDDTLPAIAVPRADPQVVKALAILAGYVDLWEAAGQARTLDLYLHSRAPGLPHPLRGLRQYRPFNDTVEDAAALLRLGGPAMMP